MKLTRHYLQWITISLCLLLSYSCNHKDLLYEGVAGLHFSFDWSQCPGATPQLMRLAVFQDGNHQLDIPFDPEGGSTTLNSGSYGFIAYNSESEVLSTSGSTFDDYEIFSRSADLALMSPMFASRRAPHARGTENQPVIYSPDELWTSAHQAMISANTTSVTMQMQPATTEYSFIINNVANLATVTEVMATVSGMSSSWSPVKAKCSDTHCIIPFEVKSDGQSTLTARVRCFGHCPDDVHFDHMLVIYVMLTDQSKWYYTFDITEALHDSNHHSENGSGGTPEIPIVLDELPLPTPVPAEGMGLQPKVDDWQEVTIEKEL